MELKIDAFTIKRGLEQNLPQLLPGELGFTLDTLKLFIGSENGNIPYTNSPTIEKALELLKEDILDYTEQVVSESKEDSTIELTSLVKESVDIINGSLNSKLEKEELNTLIPKIYSEIVSQIERRVSSHEAQYLGRGELNKSLIGIQEDFKELKTKLNRDIDNVEKEFKKLESTFVAKVEGKLKQINEAERKSADGLTNQFATKADIGHRHRIADVMGLQEAINAGGGGSGTPGGSDTQIQYNNAGSFGGSVDLTWDNGTQTLGLGLDAGAGNLRAGSLNIDTDTGLSIATDSTTRLGILTSGAWELAGDAGDTGEVLTSQGSGGAPIWTIPAGGGDVVGPASSTDNAVPRFVDTTGKIIENTGVIIDDNDSLLVPNNIDVEGEYTRIGVGLDDEERSEMYLTKASSKQWTLSHRKTSENDDLYLFYGDGMGGFTNAWITHINGNTDFDGDITANNLSGTNTGDQNLSGYVTLTGSEVLTNKTLTSPIINTATIGTSLVPTTSDGAALGSTTKMFSDLFLASGGVVDFNNGDMIITHSADVLTVDGGTFKVANSGTERFSVTSAGLTTITANDATAALSITNNHASGKLIAIESSKLVVDSAGLVGIGTATPLTLLHLATTANNTDGQTMRFENTDTTMANNQGYGKIEFAGNDVDQPNVRGYIYGLADNTNGGTGSFALAFGTSDAGESAPSEKMRISRVGNLGIGTTSVGFSISFAANAAKDIGINNSVTDVVGQALTLRAGSTLAGTAVSDVAGGQLILRPGLGTGTGDSSISFQTGTTLTTGMTLQTISQKMILLGNGNLGVGLNNPLTKINASQTTDGAAIRVSSQQNDSAHVTTTPFGSFEVYSLDATGPGAGVRGAMRVFPNTTTGSSSAMVLTASSTTTNDVELMRLDGATGFVGVGTTAAPGARLDVNGAIIPTTNDIGALGTASLSWADLFLASGAVINFANGNAAITHSSGILTVSTGDLRVTTAGTNSASVVTNAGTQTITNKRINPRVISAASYTTDTGSSLDVSTADMFIVTAQAGALKFNNPSGTPTEGQLLTIRIKDNGTARALTYDTQFRASSDLALPTTTILSKTLYMKFIFNSTDTKWDLLAFLNNFT